MSNLSLLACKDSEGREMVHWERMGLLISDQSSPFLLPEDTGEALFAIRLVSYGMDVAKTLLEN